MTFSRKSALDDLLHRPEQESIWSRLLESPVRVFAEVLYNYCASGPFAKNPRPGDDETLIRVVCISDTHNTQIPLPDGDILIHAGDLTQSGTTQELNAQIEWLNAQPHQYKIVIAGNHELCLDRSLPNNNYDEEIDWKSLIYLHNSSVVLKVNDQRSLKVFGSPHTPKQGNWAFQYPRDGNPWEDIGIPPDTQILITHGPPMSHLDLGNRGCRFLLAHLWSMKEQPRLHVFGHIHRGHGSETLWWDSFQLAYEKILNDDTGWVDLAKLGYHAIAKVLGGRNMVAGRVTTMVNASVVGGLRDEKLQGAVRVDI